MDDLQIIYTAVEGIFVLLITNIFFIVFQYYSIKLFLFFIYVLIIFNKQYE